MLISFYNDCLKMTEPQRLQTQVGNDVLDILMEVKENKLSCHM